MTTPDRLLLFAPGAGAPSSSAWMRAWSKRLSSLGRVVLFDYPYQRAGKKSPDRPPVLIGSHRNELERLQSEHPGPIVLIGKSMGGRIGCHVAVELAAAAAPGAGMAGRGPAALVCLGYPLVAPGGAVRDQVLLDLQTPVLFVQGTRDNLCPLERLAAVRERMRAPHELHVVEGGDHSLLVTQGALKKRGIGQADVDGEIAGVIGDFVARWA